MAATRRRCRCSTTPPGGVGEGYISADLGPVRDAHEERLRLRTGRRLRRRAGATDCNGTATVTTVLRDPPPQNFGTTGARSFATNASNSIWYLAAATAPTEPFARLPQPFSSLPLAGALQAGRDSRPAAFRGFAGHRAEAFALARRSRFSYDPLRSFCGDLNDVRRSRRRRRCSV